MKLYTPKNTEFFQLSASDFLTAGEGDWRAERLADGLADPDDQSERERAAEKLAGFYWWTCSPGCMPESDASGPFDT